MSIQNRMKPIKSISRPIEIGLRLTGIWPDASYKLVVRLAWVVTLIATQICQLRYIIKHLSSLVDLVEAVGTSLPYSLLCFKLLTFWTDHRTIRSILVQMTDDWTHSSNEKFNESAMVRKADQASNCTKLIMTLYIVAAFIYGAVFLELVREGAGGKAEATSRQLLLKMDFPFAYYENPAYEYVFIGQFLQLLVNASAIAMLDALMITLIFHIGGQIEILHKDLADICPKDENYELPKIAIKSLIDRHYRIILNAEYIEKLFTYIALMQLLCNTLVICCIGFLVTIALNSGESLKSLIKICFFYIAITLEAFIFSFVGEYLSIKSVSVAHSAYSSLWYQLSNADKRVVILLMIRSQRRLTITAGKFAELSMEGFANTLKASASYVSILYAMY